ncbi:hypothetical protein [Glycomyces sp. NPDC021274]|uniref:hypothetical protein n=1 Tax=Glycomyces sp. NPDC021274 TaxID=3155120 RepID=UPI0033FC4A70
MASISRAYMQQIYQQFQMFATWPTQSVVNLGDVGVMKDRLFRKVSHLDDFNVRFKVEPVGPEADQNYTTSSQISVSTSIGQPPVVGITFGTEGSTYLQARNCRRESLGNLLELERSLLELYRRSEWNPEHVIITSVLRASPTIILIAGSGGGSIELSLPAGVIIDELVYPWVSGSVAIKKESGISVRHVTKHDTTPWFGASQLRRPFRKEPTLQFLSGDDESDMALETLKWDDF